MTNLSGEQLSKLRAQFEIWWRPLVTEENFAGYSTAEIEHEEWRAWGGYLAHAAMMMGDDRIEAGVQSIADDVQDTDWDSLETAARDYSRRGARAVILAAMGLEGGS